MSENEEKGLKEVEPKKNYKVLVGGLGATALVMGSLFYYGYSKHQKVKSGGNSEEKAIASKGSEVATKDKAAGENLKQTQPGDNYNFDTEGNVKSPQVSQQGVPENRYGEPATGNPYVSGGYEGEKVTRAAFGGGDSYQTTGTLRGIESSSEISAKATIEELGSVRRTCLAYSSDQTQRIGEPGEGGSAKSTEGNSDSIKSLERMAENAMKMAQGGGQGKGNAGTGEAVHHAVASTPGALSDMRVQRNGKAYVIREGEYLDATIVNRAVIDRENVPVKAIVRRDFISDDGSQVLIPAGSTVLMVGGKVQVVEQERIYLKSHRLLFPNSSSVYFPERQLPEGLDLMGGLGVPGSVNRHWALQFLAAIGIGCVEGVIVGSAGSVQSSPLGANILTAKQNAVMMAGQNFNEVARRILDKYGHVAPTITLQNGSPIKVYFSADVAVNAYRPVGAASWYTAQQRVR